MSRPDFDSSYCLSVTYSVVRYPVPPIWQSWRHWVWTQVQSFFGHPTSQRPEQVWINLYYFAESSHTIYFWSEWRVARMSVALRSSREKPVCFFDSISCLSNCRSLIYYKKGVSESVDFIDIYLIIINY